MTKKELADKHGRNVSSLYRILKKLYGSSIIDLTPEVIKAVDNEYKILDENKVKKNPHNEVFYRKFYANLCETGYITTEDIRKVYNHYSLEGLYNMLDSMGLFVYNSSVRIPSKDKNCKNKMISVACIKPCALAWKD